MPPRIIIPSLDHTATSHLRHRIEIRIRSNRASRNIQDISRCDSSSIHPSSPTSIHPTRSPRFLLSSLLLLFPSSSSSSYAAHSLLAASFFFLHILGPRPRFLPLGNFSLALALPQTSETPRIPSLSGPLLLLRTLLCTASLLDHHSITSAAVARVSLSLRTLETPRLLISNNLRPPATKQTTIPFCFVGVEGKTTTRTPQGGNCSLIPTPWRPTIECPCTLWPRLWAAHAS